MWKQTGFNRTFMELKLQSGSQASCSKHWFYRTFMELKSLLK